MPMLTGKSIVIDIFLIHSDLRALFLFLSLIPFSKFLFLIKNEFLPPKMNTIYQINYSLSISLFTYLII